MNLIGKIKTQKATILFLSGCAMKKKKLDLHSAAVVRDQRKTWIPLQATDKGRPVMWRPCPRNTLKATIEKTTSYLSTLVFAPRKRIAGIPAAPE